MSKAETERKRERKKNAGTKKNREEKKNKKTPPPKKAKAKKTHLGSVASILLSATIICFTPSVYASSACSRVCPSLEIPASNPPGVESMISTAQSACDVPVIMFLMKSRWPGASMTVQ